MSSRRLDFCFAVGGAAGQGIATPGNILARIFVRQGLHLSAYNAHQSIIRGGHILLTVRVSDQEIGSHGNKIDLLLCLNQDTLDRHIHLMGPGSWVLYNSDAVGMEDPPDGVHMCGIPVVEVTEGNRNRLVQNTVALGAIVAVMGMDFQLLEAALKLQFSRKGEEVISENITVARAGFDYANEHFAKYPEALPQGARPLAVWNGNEAMAMGGAAAGVKFYCAYPMSPATGILHWMANNARELNIMVRQVEDEIAVANMTIGAAHAGCRAMCATSGGGFALMTEAIGMAGIMEIPVVFINVQRAGPSTGVPTKTEQGDLWQVLGASQGDFERVIVAPLDALDAFNTMPELFNQLDKRQCPGIVISDLLISEGTFSVDPDLVDMHPAIDRGALITEPSPDVEYLRFKDTESGISPRALPGLEGYVHVVASDEHDENGVLISDEFTNPHIRRKMVEKRARKMAGILDELPAPSLLGPKDAEVTLIGWGSTYGVIQDALGELQQKGIRANHLPIKWILPFHGEAVTEILAGCRRTLIVENNYSGQFARYLRAETGFSANGHIRKYDGEPFMPKHIVQGVVEHLEGAAEISVPHQEVMV